MSHFLFSYRVTPHSTTALFLAKMVINQSALNQLLIDLELEELEEELVQ